MFEHCAGKVRMGPQGRGCVAIPAYAKRGRNSDQAFECPAHRTGAMVRTECADCPPGFQRQLGEDACSKCLAGSKQPTLATSCELCPTGQSNNNNGSVLCFGSVTGSEAAQPMPPLLHAAAAVAAAAGCSDVDHSSVLACPGVSWQIAPWGRSARMLAHNLATQCTTRPRTLLCRSRSETRSAFASSHGSVPWAHSAPRPEPAFVRVRRKGLHPRSFAQPALKVKRSRPARGRLSYWWLLRHRRRCERLDDF